MNKRGAALAVLPAVLNAEQRLTADQAMALVGAGKSRFYSDVKRGKLPPPCIRDGRFVRWRAGDLLDVLAHQRAPAEAAS